MEWLQNILEIDKEVFLNLNSLYTDYWDTVMLMITRKETWFPFYAILIFFIIKIFRTKSIPILFFIVLTIFASDQLSVLIKDSVQRLRPVHDPVIGNLVHNVLRKGSLYGFVSSHAANSFAIFAFTTLLFKNRNYWILSFFWAVLFSYSRIYAGVHYPLDILGGAVLGWFVGVLFFRILMFTENHFFISGLPVIQKTKLSNLHVFVVYLVFGVLSISVLTSSYILHHYGFL